MKATFAAEVIGHGPEIKGAGHVPNTVRPWVAVILGRDDTRGLERRFVTAKTSYADSNKTMNRGVTFWFILETGVLYEADYQDDWNTRRRCFLAVTKGGDIREVPGEEAEAWIDRLQASRQRKTCPLCGQRRSRVTPAKKTRRKAATSRSVRRSAASP